MTIARWSVWVFLLGGMAAQAGEIRGRVLTTQGVPVADARVSVEKEETQFHREALTKSDGSYSISELQDGVYSVSVTGPGGQLSPRRDVVVGTPDSSVRMDFRLPTPLVQPPGTRDDGTPGIGGSGMDLAALRRRLTIVRGPDPQYIREFLPEQNYFGAEFGAGLREFTPLNRRSVASRWTYSVAHSIENSVLNARSFFQVGPLRPSRVNQYELSAGGPLLPNRLSMAAQLGRLQNSGEVNGNVQAPKADERIPRSADPRANAILAGLLGAFPSALPNSPHVTERQLNANAPRKIGNQEGSLRLDFRPAENSALALRYAIQDYSEDPFELVIGENPKTDTRNQGLRASLTHNFSPTSVGRAGFDFDRAAAALALTRRYRNLLSALGPGTAVPDVEFQADSLQDIGPGSQFPRFRAQNRFQFYADGTKITGRHSVKAGWGTARVQVNDLQSDHTRGTLVFAADFGHSEIENFLLGRPTQFLLTFGNPYRGFRSWEHFFYLGDQVRLTPTLSVSLGVRYELQTAPTEANDLTDVGYSTDRNNIAPRFGFAWNPRRGSLTIRGGYGISYGSVFPATYQFARFNPPASPTVQVSAPDITTLLAIPKTPEATAQRFARNVISPDLVTPYSHQYTLGVEGTLPGSLFLRLAYMGWRSFHLFTQNIENRARPVPGISPTTANVDERRPDHRFYDVTKIESNSIAYYDAAQLSLEKRLSRGLAFRATYTFSKNMDLGGSFTNTASGVERPPEAGILSSELVSRRGDLKGWSSFDTPHNLTFYYAYALPSVGHIAGWKGLLLRDWEVSGTTVFQSGIPWHVQTADGPGFGNVDGVRHDRPNLLNPAILGKSFDNPDTSASLLRREDFDTIIPPGGRGNLGFHVFRKDGTRNWNVSIGKAFRFRRGGEASVQFRAAFLNLFNHPQFDKPGFDLTSPFFGRITNTVNGGRVAQLSVRVNF